MLGRNQPFKIVQISIFYKTIRIVGSLHQNSGFRPMTFSYHCRYNIQERPVSPLFCCGSFSSFPLVNEYKRSGMQCATNV